MSRPLRPNVIAVFDNPVAQVKCEPDRDEINVDALLNEIMVRFEFGIGTSFDLQFLTMDGTKVLAMRRYFVSSAVESIVTLPMNFDQTMTRSVFHRMCVPISDWFIFDKVAEVLRSESAAADDDIDFENASPAVLQAFVKAKRGRGFRPGTSYEDMLKKAREYA